MLTKATARNRTAESEAERRSSGQLTVERPTPHMFIPSQLDVAPDTVFELWKRFQTHHTAPNSQGNSAIILGCANYLVVSVIC